MTRSFPTVSTTILPESGTDSTSFMHGIPAAKFVRLTRQRASKATADDEFPYGYKKIPDDPKKWIVDEEAAQIEKERYFPPHCL